MGCPHPNRPLLLSNHPFRLNPPKQLNLPNLPISLELLLHVHNLLQSLPCAPPCPAMVSPLSLQMPSTGSSHLSPQTTHSLPRVEGCGGCLGKHNLQDLRQGRLNLTWTLLVCAVMILVKAVGQTWGILSAWPQKAMPASGRDFSGWIVTMIAGLVE